MARKADKETELVLEGLSVPAPKRMDIPVACIRHTQRNPRGSGADDEEDLEGLVASLESTPEPDLVQAPAVQQVGPDDYIVIYGDRRVRAVKLAGWAMVSCDARTSCLARAVIWRFCEAKNLTGRTVTLKVKYSRPPAAGPSSEVRGARELAGMVSALLEPLFPVDKGIRLLGVTLSSLETEGERTIS